MAVPPTIPPHEPLSPELRIQEIISVYRGPYRGESLAELHKQCADAMGERARFLVPEGLFYVKNLAPDTLASALKKRGGRWKTVPVKFRLKAPGRFDSALLPHSKVAEGTPDRWLLVMDEDLNPRDQVALYAHAVGHLVYNHTRRQMHGRGLVSAADGFAHPDRLADLRAVEVRNPHDRPVLESFPALAEKLEVALEGGGDISLVSVREVLTKAGWKSSTFEAPYSFTDGRIYPSSGGSRRGRKLRADALLRLDTSHPIALVLCERAGESVEQSLARLHDYARERMALPFGYFLQDNGDVIEVDWTGSKAKQQTLPAFPDRGSLQRRWLEHLNLRDERAERVLLWPFQSGAKRPRYYQIAAINQALAAILQARRGHRAKRVLVTMATGTGKTKVAFQLIWKLHKGGELKRVLFLADRDYLVSQAMDNEFAPFADGRWRIQREINTGRHIYFATYQALADTEASQGLYQQYPPNFFDLIVVDECHRGSAQDESNWRRILDYFHDAVQVGLTATPLRTDNVETYRYFGTPVYTYSLHRGINDGFLAPYRVRRILMGTGPEAPLAFSDEEEAEESDLSDTALNAGEAAVSEGQLPAQGAPESGVDAAKAHEDDAGTTPREGETVVPQTVATLRQHTETIAAHLAGYLERTDPMGKTIIFCVDQDHAATMLKALKEKLSEWVKKHPDYLTRIVADEGSGGKTMLGRFSTPGETVPVLVTTSQLLSTGVDVPTCKNVVLARPVGSMVEFKQIIGRGSRLHEPTKTSFTIIDYSGATRLFFDPRFEGPPELATVERMGPSGEVLEDAEPDQEVSEPEGSAGTSDPTDGFGEHLPTHAQADTPGTAASKGNQTGTGGEREAPERADGSGDEAFVETGTQQVAARRGAQGSDDTTASHDDSVPDESPEAAAGGDSQEPPSEITPPSVMGAGGDGIDATVGPTADQASPKDPPSAPNDSGASERDHSSDTPTIDSATQTESTESPPEREFRRADGIVVKVVGEIVYELGPDGKTLREQRYKAFAKAALESLSLLASPKDLVARWVRTDQRDEIRERLDEEGVNLEALAASLNLPEADPLDLLLHVAFGQPPLTRRERAERVMLQQVAFFERHAEPARQILEVILNKYVEGETWIVNDLELLNVPPLSEWGTRMELVKRFGGGQMLKMALQELQVLLYKE